MTGRILVGVDGSQGSRRAMRWALEEAVLRGSILEAVTVWQSPFDLPWDFDFSYPVDEAKLAENARARLTETIGEIVDNRAGVELERVVLEGDPAETLCKRGAGADLLVVGSRGYGALAGLLLGSVSSKCAHHSRGPVVIVPGARRGDEVEGPSLTGRIVVGFDASPGSRRALRWAIAEAETRGATVLAVMVWGGARADDVVAKELATLPALRRDDQADIELATKRLKEIVSEVLGEAPFEASVKADPVVIEGNPAETLCRYAAEADMLVVGKRGHGTFPELSLGSVSDRCARHSTRPVVIVPADGSGHESTFRARSSTRVR